MQLETYTLLKCRNYKSTEVIKMKELKGWPFEPLDGDAGLCGESSGGGGFPG